jgi:DNA-binding transcriptional regulator YdaS (Cro superfamily)
MDKKHPDSRLIDLLGGTNAVARLCEVQPPSVSEWRYTGIPRARLKYLQLAKPEVFREEIRRKSAFGAGRRG